MTTLTAKFNVAEEAQFIDLSFVWYWRGGTTLLDIQTRGYTATTTANDYEGFAESRDIQRISTPQTITVRIKIVDDIINEPTEYFTVVCHNWGVGDQFLEYVYTVNIIDIIDRGERQPDGSVHIPPTAEEAARAKASFGSFAKYSLDAVEFARDDATKIRLDSDSLNYVIDNNAPYKAIVDTDAPDGLKIKLNTGLLGKSISAVDTAVKVYECFDEARNALAKPDASGLDASVAVATKLMIAAGSGFAGRVVGAAATPVLIAGALAVGAPVFVGIGIGLVVGGVVAGVIDSYSTEKAREWGLLGEEKPKRMALADDADNDPYASDGVSLFNDGIRYGEAAPEPQWEYDAAKKEFRWLVEPDEVVIREIATRLGLEVDNPIAFNFIGRTGLKPGQTPADLGDCYYGGAGDDTMDGTHGDDVLFGQGGQDSLLGGFHDDALDGGAGDDTLRGGDSDDFLDGDAGADQLFGDDGHDQIFGNAGEDFILGGKGADQISGGAGRDSIAAQEGSDEVTAGEGDDVMWFGLSEYYFEIDWLHGDDGDDRFVLVRTDGPRVGFHHLVGGDGHDVVSYELALAAIGLDLNVTNGAADGAWGAAAGDSLSVEEIVATRFNDVVIGRNGPAGEAGAVDDLFRGMAGSDELRGGAGDDTLDGGAGRDTMVGGAEDDVFLVNARGDVVVELAGEGRDRVLSQIGGTLADHVEELTLVGRAAVGIGNAENNLIIGNALANRLDGKVGADRMVGGFGNDRYFVDDRGDAAVEQAGRGVDTVVASVSHRLGKHVEKLVLEPGVKPLAGFGNSLDNELFGNAGDNRLSGLRGSDTLHGGGGNDKFVFDGPLDEARTVDYVSDFSGLASQGGDTIELGAWISLAVGNKGALKAAQFKTIGVAGSKVDANDRIVYDLKTGDLFVDYDGSGAMQAVRFAQLMNQAPLSASDFILA
jgi:Ca2+-binding RTX toxin-like protein